MSAAYDLIIVHYRDPSSAGRLVRQSQGWTVAPRHIVIADNSADFPADPAVQILELPANPGYAAAINAGVAHLADSASDYLLFATQDAAAAPDAVERMLACLESRPEAAVAAPLLAFRSDPSKVFSAGGLIDAKGRTYHAGWRRPVLQWAGRPDMDVAWADGAFLLVRKSALKAAGPMRDDFFLYFEEVEFQLRLRLSGWSVRLVPGAVCSQEPGNLTAYLRVRNRILLIRAFPYYFDLRLRFSLLDTVKTCAIALRNRRLSGIFWAWRGLRDGLRGRAGKPPDSLFAANPGGPL
jgi:GT2 family glycosyltransferase